MYKGQVISAKFVRFVHGVAQGDIAKNHNASVTTPHDASDLK